MKIITKNDCKEKHNSWEASVDGRYADMSCNYDFYVSAYGETEEMSLHSIRIALKLIQEELSTLI